jgi:hypothetical protein
MAAQRSTEASCENTSSKMSFDVSRRLHPILSIDLDEAHHDR